MIHFQSILERFTSPPCQVVSLVPSTTESLFDLGLGQAVIGITDYCVYPAGSVDGLPRLGGTKNPRVEQILSLKPDLVLANQEENNRETIETVEAAGIPVWVSFPKTVAQTLEFLRNLARLFQSRTAAQSVEILERSVAWTQSWSAGREPVRYFCPIWYDHTSGNPPFGGDPYWMTFNRDTYCHDVLALFGADNVFAWRERRYPLEADLNRTSARDPGGRDTRYPRIGLPEIREVQPELILLPSEPYPFNENHRQELNQLLWSDQPAFNSRICLIDGSLVTWPGTRLSRALQALPILFDLGK